MWDFIKNLFQKEQTHPQYNRVIFNRFGQPVVLSDSNDKTSYIEDGYQKNATVFSIINLILKGASVVPIKVYEKKDLSALKDYKALTKDVRDPSTIIAAMKAKQRALVSAEESDLAKLLECPNPDMGYTQFIKEVLAFKLLTGDSYIQGISPRGGVNKGQIQQMYALPAHLVEIVAGADIRTPISGYKLKHLGEYTHKLSYEEVCHIKNFNPDYSTEGAHLYGQSPLRAAFRNLEINNDAITTGKKYLNNQGARGILSGVDGMLTQEQAQALKQRYKAQYQGAENAGDILITSHDFKWIEMGLPAADLALIDQYNLSVKDLAAVYNVPSILLNDTKGSSISDQREARKTLYTDAIFPELTEIRDELNRWLVPTYGEQYYIDFDFMAVPELIQDMETVIKGLSLATFLTLNEKRAILGYEPMDDPKMDEIYVLANYISLSDGETTSEMDNGANVNQIA